MNIIWLAVSAFLLCVSIVSAGAAPTYPLPPVRPDAIARLAVDGQYAYINKKPAYHGSYVYNGDNVSTGAGTSATLVLNDGGTIQLDENTDPDFTLIKEGLCLLMDMVGGQAAIETKTMCVEFRNKRLKLAGVANSVINLRITDQEAWITVLEGRIQMMSPRAATLATNDRYIATSDGAVDVQPLTRADAAAAGAWRQKYFGAAPPQAQPQSGGMSTAEKAGIGIIGAIILNKIFGGGHQATGQPNATAGSGAAQGPNSGWCCPPSGAGFPSNPAACRASQGVFHPGATSSDVCRRPPNAQ